MSRVPVTADSSLRNLERSIKNLSRSVSGGSSTSGSGGADVSRFDAQYDHNDKGAGEQPVVGDTVYYDPSTGTYNQERYVKGCVGVSQSNDLTAGNSSARYPLGRSDLFQTQDGKVWYVLGFGTTSRTGQTRTTHNIKIYEVLDESSSIIDFGYSATQTATTAAIATDTFSISNVAAGDTNTFGVCLGTVNAAANTVSFFKMIYNDVSSTWSIVGGGSLNDSSMGVTYANFDLRNCDLVYDPTQADYLLFAVDATNVKIERWQESNARPNGVLTLTGKSYGIDIPRKVNGFNIATILSDGRYLVVDGTTGGNWIYSYNGSAFSPVGTNNVLSSFSNGFNGIQISQNLFAFEIAATRENSEVSYTLMEYDSGTETLSESAKTFTHTEIVNGTGRPFEADQQAFFFNSCFWDKNGNCIELDGNNDITGVTFSEGVGTAENMSVKTFNNLLYYYSDNIQPSSNSGSEYSQNKLTLSISCFGNRNNLPIFLGEVSEVTTTFPKIDCVLPNVASTSLTVGEIYGDYVALSETRLIPLNEGTSLPTLFPTTPATTTASSQELLKLQNQFNGVFHDTNVFRYSSEGKKRYLFEYNRDTNYENTIMNVFVNGVPYFSTNTVVADQDFYYLDMISTGNIVANVSTSAVARIYLFDI